MADLRIFARLKDHASNFKENHSDVSRLNSAQSCAKMMGLRIFSRFWRRLQWANGNVTRGQSLNGAR